MTKFKKFLVTISILGASFLIIGGAIFLIAFGRAGWDINALDAEELTESSYLVEQHRIIDNIELQGLWFFDISYGDYFRIDYYKSNFANLEIGLAPNANGNYTFRFIEDRNNFWPNFGFNGLIRRTANEHTVRITIPNSASISVRGSSANTTIKDLPFPLYSLDINGSNAAIVLQNINVVGNINLSGSSLWASFNNVSAYHLNASGSNLLITNSSNVNLNIGNLNLSGSDIGVNIYNLQVQNVNIDGSSARLTLRGSSVHNSINASGSGARVELRENSFVHVQLQLEGSSARANIYDSTVRHIYAPRGSGARIFAQRAHIRSLNMSGSSVRAYLDLVGTNSNVRQVSVTGSSPRLYFNGTRHNPTNITPSMDYGFKTFIADGSGARITLNMLGGVSNFTE